MAPALKKYNWILALTTIAFVFSSASNAGILACITEFVGAVALGSRVTSTIKSGFFGLSKFEPNPPTFMLVMGCAEVGSALAGAGIAAQTPLKWAWASGSLSQIAASWAIAPLIAAGFSAILFLSLRFLVLERKEPFKWRMRLIPWYLGFTAGVLALFIIDELPNGESLEEMGAGKVTGIILGVAFGVVALSYIFLVPYFHRRLVKNDARIRNPPIYFPGKGDQAVKDYYAKSLVESTTADIEKAHIKDDQDHPKKLGPENNGDGISTAIDANDGDSNGTSERTKGGLSIPKQNKLSAHVVPAKPEPEERWLTPKNLGAVHARAIVYDNRVEHLWTYAQVASAMMMSIAHGSNDVANAVGPWVATYNTYTSGIVTAKADTPIRILIVAGLLLGLGFWFYGYHVMRSLGNKITQVSPTRGFAMELGAAITVLLASRLALPVSTTQCLTGATVGVALCNFDIRAVNWKQVAFIFSSWVITLPSAGLISGLLMVMALNTPHF
ncbi:phosphate permease [Karstenula rhodostoma CBS 690.94]|uniref:Phosphate transporter n=1 Tax=Karstenula rhodostoma CBS 690.94 TaxID=1392251 RepID=A0A9P4U8F3_9PLEO|nr:phosphate permease [Karstenula rhodostoma CBS 690.94]